MPHTQIIKWFAYVCLCNQITNLPGMLSKLLQRHIVLHDGNMVKKLTMTI